MSQNLLRCLKTLHPKFLVKHHQVFVTQKATHMKWYQKDKKSGYETEIETSNKELFKEGYQILKEGIPEYMQEVKEQFACDGFYLSEHGDYEYFWKFNGAESIKNWVTTTDSDNHEGRSRASFDITSHNRAVFHGYLDPYVPKTGAITRSGYVNIRSPPNYKSFHRPIPYDWGRYTHLYLRLRGDGRTYALTVGIDNYYDVAWNDIFTFPLFTRGGPYWQVAKIPLSKFLLTHNGRVQDKQETLQRIANKVKNFGVTLADEVEGPFKLELDYIALVLDLNHTENFAYEMYRENPAYIGT